MNGWKSLYFAALRTNRSCSNRVSRETVFDTLTVYASQSPEIYLCINEKNYKTYQFVDMSIVSKR